MFLDMHEILIRHSETSLFSNYLSYHYVDNVESVRSVDDWDYFGTWKWCWLISAIVLIFPYWNRETKKNVKCILTKNNYE